MKPFDLEKAKTGAPVQTRDGRKARIICFDRKEVCFPLVALVTDLESGLEDLETYRADGGYTIAGVVTKSDLVMAPVKKEGWLNVYPSNVTSPVGVCSHIYPSQAAADEEAGKHRKACLHVKWEE